MEIKNILEFMYIVCGIVLIVSSIYSLKDKENPKRYSSALFWGIFGFLLIAGPYIKSVIVGALLLVMGVLSATKSIKLSNFVASTESFRLEQAKKIGNKIFIPAILIGVIAFSVAQFTSLGGLVGLGIGALVSLATAMIITKDNLSNVPYESSRILQQMGPTVILPQLLGALGAVFAKAGVGEVIAKTMGAVVPENNITIGVIIYCVAMALFTMIMGNAFAAFAVITAGIGYPFVIQLGGNPVVVGALGLTSGYCGTLMTPMAANFNIVPASILEMKNKNDIISKQVFIAIPLLIVHIILMRFWAF